MSSFPIETRSPQARSVAVTDHWLTVNLTDGRAVSVPLAWYPRLVHAAPPERQNWRLVGRGVGVHWPDLDEDVSVAGLLEGRASAESRASLSKWRSGRSVR